MIGEDSLLERVTAAAEERKLSHNSLLAYRRTWLKIIAWTAAEGLASLGKGGGVLSGGDPRPKRLPSPPGQALKLAREGRLRRESPVLLRLNDGSLVEGTVDLAFHEDTSDFVGWTVVDFKTDREFEATSDRYIAQVRVYSEAVSVATGSPARGIILVF